MKITILMVLSLLLMHTSAHAGATWTREDVWLESAWQMLNVIDWGQTRYVSESPDFHEWEKNPAIRPTPTLRSVDAYFITVAAFHWAVSNSVDAHNRQMWQWISLGFKAGGVFRNWSIGVGLKF